MRIYFKLKAVIVPYLTDDKIKELKQCMNIDNMYYLLFFKNIHNKLGDLWGPFLMCMFLGLILSIASTKNSGMVFTTVFVIIWIGSVIITLNTKLIGGKLY